MVKLHTAKYNQIIFLSLLLISLTSFCADDASEQEASKNITFSCNIPGLNVPLQLERTERSIHKTALIGAAIDHGRLFLNQKSTQQSAQQMVIDHALLAAFRIAIGLTSTVCHEFGHAIWDHYDPYARLKVITVRWSLASILLGSFGGSTKSVANIPDAEKDDDQSIEIQYANWIGLLHKDKDRYRNLMIGCAAGPLAGVLSAYMLYKGAGCIYPSLSYGLTTFYDIEDNISNLIPQKHILNYFCDRLAARARSDELRREVEELRAQVSESSDGDQFCEAWSQMKKVQVRIDVFQRALDEYKAKSSAS